MTLGRNLHWLAAACSTAPPDGAELPLHCGLESTVYEPAVCSLHLAHSVHGRSKCPVGTLVRVKTLDPGESLYSMPPGPGKIKRRDDVSSTERYFSMVSRPRRAGKSLSPTMLLEKLPALPSEKHWQNTMPVALRGALANPIDRQGINSCEGGSLPSPCCERCDSI